MIGTKIIAGPHSKVWYNFVVFVNVLRQLSCHIGSGMPNLYKIVEEFVALLGAMMYKMRLKTSL